MRQVSNLFKAPALLVDTALDKLTTPAPPASMFSSTSPRAVDDIDLAMSEIRLDSFHDDMLPAPEELKTSGLVPPTPLWHKRWFRLACAGLFCVMLASVLLVVARAANNRGGNDPIAENASQEGVTQITTRTNGVIDFLLKSVDHNQLTNSSSPEYRAAQWVADQDGLHMPFSPSFLERYALAALWFATEGENWWRDSPFMTEKHHCKWSMSLPTVDKTVFVGVRCNEKDEVTSLVLRKYQSYIRFVLRIFRPTY